MGKCIDCRYGGIFNNNEMPIEECCRLINDGWKDRENEWRPDKEWSCPGFKPGFILGGKIDYPSTLRT